MDRQEWAWRRVAEYAAAGGGPVSLETVGAATAAAVDADGYGVTLVTAPGMRSLASASDPDGAWVEEAQLACGQGPCTDAYARLAPVLVPDLDAAADRWPGYISLVAGRGVRAMFAFPLEMGGLRIGAMDVFRRRTGGLTEDQRADAQAFAGVAAGVAFRLHPAPATLADALGDAPPHGFPAVVHQAAGMVAARLDMNVTDALARLRAYAFLHDTALTRVARQVLGRRLDLDRDPGPGSGPHR
ncbi:GAF and ANTAR domain-containing protein [Actinomadura gamaensis]|uniref:GAF and ANTAR domain-containing protein n=1 Tax=Actinomadura gamaensis TaxID=1763541 RepID=A0ABV9U9G7_9ACTN